MKKYLLTLAILLSLAAGNATAQSLQRLAILPTRMGLDNTEITSLCLDLFKSSPDGDRYAIEGASHETFYADGYWGGHTPSGNANFETVQYASTAQVPVPDYYKKFINSKIAEYNNSSHISQTKLESLQNEIWVFNGMDGLSLIDKTSTNILNEYNFKRKGFAFEHDIPEKDFEAIVEVIEQLHEIRKTPAPAAISNVQFTSTGISSIINGRLNHIEVEYTDLLYTDLSAQTQQVAAKYRKFYQTYHVLPEEVTFSAYASDPGTSLLRFSAEGDYGYYVMQFKIPLNKTGLEQIKTNIYTGFTK